MENTYYIGVDVSKNKLDIAIIQGGELLDHHVISNEKEAIREWFIQLKSLVGFKKEKCIFCMEHTGVYNLPLLSFLYKKKVKVCLEAASQIKNSMGNVRGKNDKSDAIRIGKYAYRNAQELRLWQPKREVLVKLDRLNTLRSRLLSMKNQLEVPIREGETFFPKLKSLEKKLAQRTINSLKADIEKINTEIDLVITQDARLQNMITLITSVNGVGRQTAIEIVYTSNEFEDIQEPKKFACYAGVAPFKKESGIFKGKPRVSQMANKKMKTLLHMCAIVAINHNDDIKAYYERKVKEGKNKMAVLNAVRNKLIHRIYACVKQNRKYENSYLPTLA